MQHPTRDFLRHDMLASLRRWTGLEPPDEDPPIATTLAAMDAASVDFGLLSAWHAPEGPLIGNEAVAAWIAEQPERLGGLAAVDLALPMQAMRELRRCVEEHDFLGLRVVPWLWGLPPNDRRYYPLYAACVELDVPELTIVAGHIGYPWTEEMIAVARKYENVYIDTSASPRAATRPSSSPTCAAAAAARSCSARTSR